MRAPGAAGCGPSTSSGRKDLDGSEDAARAGVRPTPGPGRIWFGQPSETSSLSRPMAWVQDWSAGKPLSIDLTAGPKTCDWMIESSGPLNCGTTPSARRLRISPTGAFPKKVLSSFFPVTAGSVWAATVLGKVPAAWKADACCSGWVSHSASAAASAGCLEVLGTVRNEPPQLAAPPGNTSAKSQPVLALPPPVVTCPLTTPSIQPGQTKVAKLPSTNALPLPQSHWLWLAERPFCAAVPSCVHSPCRVALPSTFSWPSRL